MRHEIKAMTLVLAATIALGACRRQPPPEPAPQQQPPATTPTPPPPTPTPTPDDGTAERERIRNTIMEMVFFDYDRSEIRPDARAVLDQKVPLLRADPTMTLRIEGHADERGSAEYNLALGLRRATAAQQYLSGFGLDASRFETATFGEERPLDRGQNEAAWARNRRAEFHITAGRAADDR